MPSFVCQRQTIGFDGLGFNSPQAESVVVHAANETEARVEAAKILGVPAHDIKATDLSTVVLPG